jgi:hypothetical protein
MGKVRTLLTGIGLGAGWTYFCDPQCGKRRRSLLRDRFTSEIRHTGRWFDKALRDLEHRIEGSLAVAKGLFESHTASDATLCERVRAKLGHIASHPRLIEVVVNDGRVTLSGSAPADEIERIAMGISLVRGVRTVDVQLDDRLGPDVMLDGRHRVAPRLDVLRNTWSPGTRLAVGVLGGALMLNCAVRRTPKAILLGTLGFGLLARAAGNRDMVDLIEEGKEMARPVFDRLPRRGRSIEPATARR